MAKANLTLPDGTKVSIEGTADEVAVLLGKFSDQESGDGGPKRTVKKSKKKKNRTKGGDATNRAKGPTAFITELAQEGYLKTRRTIGDIKKKLEERGHIYAQTSLSTPLLRLTKSKVIRRLKEKKGWVYVK